MAVQSIVYLVHWPVHLNPDGNHPAFPTRTDGSRDIVTDWPLSKTWEQMEAVNAKGQYLLHALLPSYSH